MLKVISVTLVLVSVLSCTHIQNSKDPNGYYVGGEIDRKELHVRCIQRMMRSDMLSEEARKSCKDIFSRK